MKRRAKVLVGAGLFVAVLASVMAVYAHLTFPSDQTPEGAYARIAISINKDDARSCFAYIETRAQWACHSIHDYRARSSQRVASSYPEPDKARWLEAYRKEADAHDGADVWLLLAQDRGWVRRLRADLSGIKHVEVAGARATVETARGTRYAFRRGENGIWGLTMFTAELIEASERAARDNDLVSRAAADYDRERGSAEPPVAERQEP